MALEFRIIHRCILVNLAEQFRIAQPPNNHVRRLLNEGVPVSISKLRDLHRGEAVYLLGSGKSLDFVPRDFFDGKTVVGVNATHRDWPTTYLFAHHREDAQDAINHSRVVVASILSVLDMYGP